MNHESVDGIAGSYFLEHALPPKLDINTNANCHFFQPPTTPSASTFLRTSTYGLPANTSISGSNISRKRSRTDSLLSEQTTPYTPSADGWSTITPSEDRYMAQTPRPMSPMPFVNTQYRIAGGLDTPTAALSSAFEIGSTPTVDVNFRRGGGLARTPSYFHPRPLSSGLARESNGRPRLYKSSNSHLGWTRSALSTLTSLTGALWDFCRTTTFHGFYAGGGKSYLLSQPSQYLPHPPAQSTQPNIWQDVDGPSKPLPITAFPSGFPDEDFIPDYMSAPSAHPLKRPKTTHNTSSSSLKSSWVLLPNAPASRSPSPTRLHKRPSTASTPSARRPAPRPIQATRASPALARAASSASPRATQLSPTRPTFRHRHTRSDGGVGARVGPEEGSGLSPEAKKFRERVRRKERKESKDLGRLNGRLKDMIREGKEALGMRVEILSGEEEDF